MAINFKDGVILGADSRTTTGAYIANRVTDKLTQVADTIWCCRSGSAADTQAVADIVQYYLSMYATNNDEPPTTQTAAAIFQEICYSNKDQLRWVCRITKDQHWMANITQCWHHHCRIRSAKRRPGLFYPPGRLAAQTGLRHCRLRLDVHLRILRFLLEGVHDGRRGNQLCKGSSERSHQVGRKLGRCNTYGRSDGKRSSAASVST
jgi:hypothetical protein